MDIFRQRLRDTAAAIEKLLDTLLPHPQAAAAPRLAAAMRHAVLGGGKRLRPFLVREAARLFGGDDAQALHVGAALECLHCYSLVHDDLPAMDDDDLRRGRPTVHKAFDEATAILAGDALLTLAFALLADARALPDATLRARLVTELAQAAGEAGMVGGQMLDLEAEARTSHTLEEVLTIQRLKTGALFRFALRAGALLGHASADDLARMDRLADAIGLAFQITDDILDMEATAEELGKTPGKDAAAGKATFVDLLGLDGARRRARELLAEALDTLSPYGEQADVLRAAAEFIVSRRH